MVVCLKTLMLHHVVPSTSGWLRCTMIDFTLVGIVFNLVCVDYEIVYEQYSIGIIGIQLYIYI